MQPANCPRCGKVFVKIRDPICAACIKDEEEIFEKVREYVIDNPNQSIKEVAEACEVSVKRIITYLKDGKLDASSGMAGELLCSKCGKPILTGRMCEKCILETNFEVSSMKNQYKNKGRVFTKKD